MRPMRDASLAFRIGRESESKSPRAGLMHKSTAIGDGYFLQRSGRESQSSEGKDTEHGKDVHSMGSL